VKSENDKRENPKAKNFQSISSIIFIPNKPTPPRAKLFEKKKQNKKKVFKKVLRVKKRERANNESYATYTNTPSTFGIQAWQNYSLQISYHCRSELLEFY